MGNPYWEEESNGELPFMDRFALEKWDVVLFIVAAVLVWIWVVKCGHRAYEGILERPLRVGIVSWPGYAGGLVANKGLRASKDSDFWKDKDHPLLVEFRLVEDGQRLRDDFVKGGENDGLDVIWSTVDSLARQIPDLEKAGLHPQAFMQVDWSRGGDAIVASAEIKKIEDLSNGKKTARIAVSKAASQWLLENSLNTSSMTPAQRAKLHDRQYLNLTEGSKEAYELFVKSKVDAAVLWEPYVSEALKRTGAHVINSTKWSQKLIADVMVADKKFIQEHPEAIAAFVKGWLHDGTPKANADPMLAVQVLQNEDWFWDLGEEVTLRLLGTTKFATLDDNVEMFGLDDGGGILFDRVFRQASHAWRQLDYITSESDPQQARDEGFVRELYKPPARGCQEIETSPLPIAFSAGQAELDAKARETLDDEKIAIQLSSNPEVRFLVEASAEEEGEGDPKRARDLKRRREEGVIRYLEERYDRPRRQFVSASDETYETNSGGIPCIRLKLIDPNGKR
jgi:NitT/TauT family transport system substrate-binding protein